MKKNLFWKVISILFLIWLFLWLWNRSIIIIPLLEGKVIIKTNKLTGRSYRLIRHKGWVRYDEAKNELEEKK